jgi:hypothetical protein
LERLYYGYKDLAGLGIDRSYATIIRLMDEGRFPPSVRVTPGRIGWRAADIEKYRAIVDAGGVPSWAPRPKRPAPPGPKRGRRPGTRVVRGDDGVRRLVAAEAVI